jgi:hypothetical protein
LAAVVAAIVVLEPIDDLVDWRALQGAIDTSGGTFVAAPSWIQAGKTAWALGPDAPVVCLCAAPHQFQFTRDQRAYLGRDAVLVMRPRTVAQMLPRYERSFASIQFVREVPIRGKLTVELYLARDFQRPLPR